MHIAKHPRLDGSYLLVLAGELDLDAAPKVEQAATHLPGHDSSCMRVIVDLMDVSFIDCAGLGALIGLANTARHAGLSFTILDPSDRVMRLIRLTELNQAFDVELTPTRSAPAQVPSWSHRVHAATSNPTRSFEPAVH
jgi:anti-anti-sigma factor